MPRRLLCFAVFSFYYCVVALCSSHHVVKLPVKHLEALVSESLNIAQVLDGSVLFALGLARVAVEQMAEVTDAVMTVLVQRAQKFLEALLDAVSVDWAVVQGVSIAGHGVTLLFVNGGQHALLVHGRKLSFLHHVLVLHRLDQFLEPNFIHTQQID